MDEFAAILGITHVAEFNLTDGINHKKQKQTTLSKHKVEIKEVGHKEKVPSASIITLTTKKTNANRNEIKRNSGKSKCVGLKHGKSVKEEVLEHLDQHVMTDGSGIPVANIYGCKVCLKTFSRSSRLKYHMKTHESPEYRQEEKLLCNICSKLFSNSISLKAHLKNHDKSE